MGSSNTRLEQQFCALMNLDGCTFAMRRTLLAVAQVIGGKRSTCGVVRDGSRVLMPCSSGGIGEVKHICGQLGWPFESVYQDSKGKLWSAITLPS